MATGQQIIDFCRPFLKNMPTAVVSRAGAIPWDLVALNRVLEQIHVFYPWRWALVPFTPIEVTDDVQDFDIAEEDLETLHRPISVYLEGVSDNVNVRPVIADMIPINGLPVNTSPMTWECIERFSWKNSQIRLLYRAAVPTTGWTVNIKGEFMVKYVPLEDLADDIAGIPDGYTNVIQAGMLWQMYQYSDDKRAGTTQFVKGRTVHTGQLAEFMAALQGMAANEDIGDGDQFRAPMESLFDTY